MMFDQLVESSVNKKTTDQSWTMIVSAALQAGIVFIFVLIPLLYTEALPNAVARMFLVAPPRPAAFPHPPSGLVGSKPVSQIIHQGQIVTPVIIPRTVNLSNDDALGPDVTTGGPGGDTNGVPGGEPDGLPNGIPGATGTNTPPPPPATPVQRRIRVGGQVQAAKMLREVQPVYPQIAKTARIQGIVVLRAIIGRDGSVQELTYVSGPPLLMTAAMQAVRQWKYQPTLLNGEPVEIDTTISAVFTLGGQN